MSIASLLHQRITVLQAGTSTNRAGDVLSDWNTTDEVATVNGWIQPRRASEDTNLRQQDGVRAKGYFMVDAPIAATSRLQDAQGQVWQVIGPPMVITAPGRNSHLQVDLAWLEG